MENKFIYSERVANSITAMLAYWDSNQICRFANAAYMEWFGKRAEDMIDKMSLKELLGPLYPKNLPYIDSALKGKPQTFERDIRTPDGKIRHSLATYTPDIVNGKVLGIVVHVTDITNIKNIEIELTRAKKQAEELATHDYLTGLPNRLLLDDRISSQLLLSGRKHGKFAISIMDLDNFKSINDTFGHLAGDVVLIEVANRSKLALREYDTISRYGGDEFVLLLPEIEEKEQIETIGNRLIENTRLPIRIQNVVVNPSVSLGVAIYPDDGDTAVDLLRNADIALYKAKNHGKNCLVFAGP